MRSLIASLALPILLLGTPLHGAAQQASSYRIVALGTLGGSTSTASDINNRNEISGSAATADGGRHAFVYANGTMRDVSNGMAVSLPSGYRLHTASGDKINDSGVVAGSAALTDGEDHVFGVFVYADGAATFYATGTREAWIDGLNNAGKAIGSRGPNLLTSFAYEQGQITDLAVPVNDLQGSQGVAINARGELLVNALAPSGERPYIRSAKGWTGLPTLGGPATATAMNDAGEVAGYSGLTSHGPDHAFLYTQGKLLDLGTLGGDYSQAVAVNDSGRVVGASAVRVSGSSTVQAVHAFLHNGTAMADLGALGGTGTSSWANSVNARGQVVGHSGTDGGEEHAVVWTNAVIRDLNDFVEPSSDWDNLYEAVKINDNGWIIGNGRTISGAVRAFAAVPAG